MPEKIKLEFVSDIVIYRCANIGDDWQEKYKDNKTVLSLITKLISAETPEDDGIAEAMEELVMEIGDGEEASLFTNGNFTVDGDVLEDEEDEDEEKGYTVDDGELNFYDSYTKGMDSFYESEMKKSKVCVIEEAVNKRHIASLEIDAPFSVEKLKYEDGWIEYDGELFISEVSEGSYIDRHLYVDGKVPGALDYIAEVEDGMLVIGSKYLEMLGVEDGTRYEIKLGRKQIRLIPETDEDEDEYEED